MRYGGGGGGGGNEKISTGYQSTENQRKSKHQPRYDTIRLAFQFQFRLVWGFAGSYQMYTPCILLMYYTNLYIVYKTLPRLYIHRYVYVFVFNWIIDFQSGTDDAFRVPLQADVISS
jgi:hypothetical protein